MKQKVKERVEVKQEIQDRIEKINQGIVPEGYKQTGVSIIPDDWELEKLEDLTNYISSGTTKVKSEFGNFPLYGSTGIIAKTDTPNYSGEKILIARVGANAGRVNTVDGSYGVSDNTLVLDVKKLINIKFLFYYLKHYNLNKLIYGTGQPLITGGSLKKLKINLPNLKTQQKITDVLATWDRVIELKEALIEGKKEQKKGCMEKLMIPAKDEVWDEFEIGDIINESKKVETNPQVDKLVTVRLHLGGVQKRELRGNETVGSTTLYKREKGQFIYGKQNFHKGSLGLVPESLDGYASSSDIPSFDFNNDLVDNLYFFYYWTQKNMYKRLSNYTTGTGSKRLNPKEFFKISMVIPSLFEQQHIANVLSTADREIELLKELVKKLKEEKKGLMQLLLTGIIRIEGDNDE